MFQSRGGLHSLPQWIEIRSTARRRINLRGWQLTLERHADNPIRIDPGPRGRDTDDILEVTITFQEDFIIPPKYARLITTLGGRNSMHRTHQLERIYSLFNHHIGELDQNTRNRNAVLDPDGFRLTLTDAEGEIIDVVGNLEDGDTQWEFPDCYVDRRRSSMMRRFDDGMPLDGTRKENWVRAIDAKHVTPGIYYGHQHDVGTPGYRGGDILPVSLSSFIPQNTGTGVVIKWTTESEFDNAGFNIYRGLSKESPFLKVNPKLIQGAGTTGERNTYKWIDATAKSGIVYYYQIEDVSFTGEGQVLTTARLKGFISAKNKLITAWSELKRLR